MFLNLQQEKTSQQDTDTQRQTQRNIDTATDRPAVERPCTAADHQSCRRLSSALHPLQTTTTLSPRKCLVAGPTQSHPHTHTHRDTDHRNVSSTWAWVNQTTLDDLPTCTLQDNRLGQLNLSVCGVTWCVCLCVYVYVCVYVCVCVCVSVFVYRSDAGPVIQTVSRQWTQLLTLAMS